MLAGCGPLPQPFRGRPGLQAERLAIPLAVRLAVPPPEQALLSDAGARGLAESVAAALQAGDVPAVATATPLPLDWRVEILAERQGQQVLPRFRLTDADGRPQAATSGTLQALRDWADPTPELFSRVAAEAAPALTRLLLQVEAARKATDPASLAAGPPRVRLAGVRGAPGDGNAALANRMRDFLGNQGYVIQDVADGAGYGLQGEVLVAAAGRGVQRVEIQWIVSRRDGEELGRVVQINEVPAGRLDRLWGDIAYAAAEEASDGIRTVIANALVPVPNPSTPLNAAPPGSAPPGLAPPGLAPATLAPATPALRGPAPLAAAPGPPLPRPTTVR